jgi:hypothetical protein
VPIKLIDSTQYHLWSDALHARQLARTATDEWDRGAYVRWAVNTAWTAFENYATDVLEPRNRGNSFKEMFKAALASRSLPAVNWGVGIWKRVLEIYASRNKFTHVAAKTDVDVLRPRTSVAENAVATMREAVKALAAHAGVASPAWVEDDAGAPFSVCTSDLAMATGHGQRADPNDPEHIRITYVWNDTEHINTYAPPGTAWEPLMDSLEKGLNVPATAIRAYRGPKLLAERKLTSRRSDG